MGKKKPFIDRKNASTFHLMHRSQRDVSQHLLLSEADTPTSEMILWPSPNNNPSTNEKVLNAQTNTVVMKEWRERLQQAGLLEDAQEQQRFMKEITGTGTFLNTQGRVASAFEGDWRAAQTTSQDLDMLEVKGQVDNIPLNEAIDEEIAAILFRDDVDLDDVEELNDEFIFDAAKEPEKDDEKVFDYDEHIRMLMEKAQRERQAGLLADQSSKNQWAKNDHAFFAGMKPLHERDNEEEEEDDDDDQNDSFAEINSALGTEMTTPGVVPKLSPDEERALCEKFAETLLEYDSDEIGDDPYEQIAGERPLEGDKFLEAALDEFLEEKEDEILIHGTWEERRRAGGSGFSVLVGKKMVPAKDLDTDAAAGEMDDPDDKPPVQEVLALAQARLQEPLLKPPPEDVLIDGQSYFSERVRNPWDCESILSTYSNLDNNPVTIGASSRRRGRTKKNQVTDEPIKKIELSNKTGLPLGVLPSRGHEKEGEEFDDEDDNHSNFHGGSTMMSVNRGLARKRDETAEEKRARKAALKEERQMARIQKKVTRQVFHEEFSKRTIAVQADDVAGSTVFRYS